MNVKLLRFATRVKLGFLALILLTSFLVLNTYTDYRLPLGVSVNSTVTPSTISKVREGYIYAQSDGSNTVTINRTSAVYLPWTTWIYVKNPDGSLKQTVRYTSSQGAGNTTVNLSLNGDYHFAIENGMRNLSFSANNKMVLETNKRKRTFRDWDDNHATKLFFYVPPATSTFTFYAQILRGSGGTVKLYRPGGSTDTSVGSEETTLTVDVQLMNWKTYTVNNPESGFWAASIDSNGSSPESTMWLEGVPNYWSANKSSWFAPQFVNANVQATVDSQSVIDDRPLIGAGRLIESSSTTTAQYNAFANLKAEVTEIGTSMANRQTSASSAVNFTNKAVDDVINKAGTVPLYFMGGIPQWMGQLSNTYPCGNNGDYDECLNDTSIHDEFVDLAMEILEYYLVTKNYDIKYIKLLDEPNNVRIALAADKYAALMNKMIAALKAHPNPKLKNLKLYAGSVTTLDDKGIQYIKTISELVPANDLAGFAVHPWMYGYPGNGNIYSTFIFNEQFNEIKQYLKSTTFEQGFTIPEINARAGYQDQQDPIYHNSFEQAIWWWSTITQLSNTGVIDAVSYYPYAEDGSVHDMRAIINQDASFKPVGHAQRFMMDSIQSKVLTSTTSSAEVDILASKSEAGNKINVMVTNKEKRLQQLTLSTRVASSGSGTATISIRKITPSGFISVAQVGTSNANYVNGVLTSTVSIDPKGLYSIDITNITPGAGSTAAVCGNNFLETGEVCDDGNTSNNDSCSSDCLQVCVNGQIWNGTVCVNPTTTGGGGTTGGTPSLSECGRSDTNGDGVFDILDFSQFASKYGQKSCSDAAQNYVLPCGSKDMNKDGQVDILDFALFASRYGKNCAVSTAQ